jgi:hypothetical protein
MVIPDMSSGLFKKLFLKKKINKKKSQGLMVIHDVSRDQWLSIGVAEATPMALRSGLATP